MTLPGSENRTAHTLNHVAIQDTVDCFHEVTHLLVRQVICHEWRVVIYKVKEMQLNPTIFKAVDFSQLVFWGVLFTETQRNFFIYKFHFMKKL